MQISINKMGTLLACKSPLYNTQTKLDLTKLFLHEVSQLQLQI